MDIKHLLRTSVALAACLSLLAIAACSREIGRDFSLSRARTLIPGESTLADAVALLGPPLHRDKTAKGETLVEWKYLRDRRGAPPESVFVQMSFDASGKLEGIVQSWDTREEERDGR